MASLFDAVENPFVQNTINSVNTPSLLEATDVGQSKPTHITVSPEVKAPVDSKLQRILDELFGLNGKERYQLWPEKVVREGLSAAHDAMTGTTPQYAVDPATGDVHTSPEMIKAGVDMSALAGSGGLGGAGSEAGVALGSTPFLRPALKYGEKLYKGKEGQQHLDVIPNDLYPTFQKQAMSGEDISNFNFGFLNHKGQFMDREAALKYAIDNGLVEPQAAQFGALTSTLMADSSKPGVAIEAMANTNKPFYSAVENAVAGAKQPKADAQQWLSFLKNQPGVKQEELQHLGLDKLSGPITKDDLLKAVQEGQPQIKEVVKGDVDKSKISDLENKYAEAQKAYDKLDFNNLKLSEVMAQPETKNLNKAREELEAAKVIPTKYSSYQLPGGENYREMLLTLPDKIKMAESDLNKAIGKSGSIPFGKGKLYSDEITRGIVNEDLSPLDLPTNLQEPARKLLEAYRNKNQNQYKSSHWDEPNVLVHIRMNDRTIDGKKSLHLEEIQSDWHQAGRKSGYKNDNPNFKETTVAEASPQIRSALEQNKFDLDKIKDSKLYDYGDGKYSLNEPANKQTIEDWNNLGIPDAPFKKTWDELALKKAINHAVKNGYDSISWTPGEAQAARYDLSKQVSSIKASKGHDGSYVLDMTPNSSSRNSMSTREIVPENKLADVVGKELAEKIVKDADEGSKLWGVKNKISGNWSQRFATKDEAASYQSSLPEAARNKTEVLEMTPKTSKEYSGLDLKVGGQGMKAFYDKMLVDKANAIGKKFGAKVSKKDIEPANKIIKEIDPKTKEYVVKNNGKEVGRFNDRSVAQSLVEELIEGNIGTSKQPVFTMPLTPELKEHVLKKGFPLFSAGVPVFTPVDHDPFESKK